MRFKSPLVPATLIRRYRRFLADIRLEGGGEATAHCPNPGSMSGLAEPGTRIWAEPNDDPGRKLNYGWRLVDHENGHFTGVDTSFPNKLVRHAIANGKIPELATCDTALPEQKYGGNSRIDFLLKKEGMPDTYLEIKSATLCRTPGLAEFPDSVTGRGAKHMLELTGMVQAGYRAIVLFLVQRTDCTAFAVAKDIDPVYSDAFNLARKAGVEVFIYDTNISPSQITLRNSLPLHRAVA